MEHRELHVAINAHLVTFGRSYRNAGVSRFTYTLLDGLSRAMNGQRYTALVGSQELPAAQAEPLAAGPALRLMASRWPTRHPVQRIVWEQLALPGELRRLRADVFHSPVNVLPARVPCASVVTIHDLAFLHYPQYFRRARRMYQRRFTSASARLATLVVADSQSTQRDLAAFFHVPAERVRVIYPAIDADFQPVGDPRVLDAFRARHNLPADYLLYLGTLEPRKNLLTLVEAYARLRARADHVPPLVLAGAKGWYYESLFERVRSLRMQEHITFAGYVAREEQPLWYAGARLFVYPSVFEGFGLPVAEALACGTPTITSNVSSLPEAGGPVALQVDPTDPEAMAHAMLGALADPHLRQRTLREGPQWTRRFSAAHMVTAYTQVYREAAALAGAGMEKRGR
jgi:glycosyltransferase involved in cell wall biosynthesis